MIFLTAFTPRYADEARQCIACAAEFGIEVRPFPLPELGSWLKNCGQKPGAILKTMQDNPGQAVVWLDADARMRRKPTLFDTIPAEIDVACHFRHGTELLSGTLYLGATARAKVIVTEWAFRCRLAPSEWDQRVLEGVLSDLTPNIFRLPSEYVRVFDDPKMGEPVIEHMQASRRLAL